MSNAVPNFFLYTQTGTTSSAKRSLAVDLVRTPTHPLERKLLAFQITNLP